MKLKSLIFFSFLCLLGGCLPSTDETTYPQDITLSQEETEKLSYALEGIFYGRTWNGEWQSVAGTTPDEKHESRIQQEKFVYNLLNTMFEEVAEEKKEHFVNLDFQLREVDDEHYGEYLNDKKQQLLFKKTSIDPIIADLFGVKRDEKIDSDQLNREVWIDGFLLSGDQYYFFSYQYYGDVLIHNKGRGTDFQITKVQQESPSDFSFFATYQDDAFSGICNVDFKAEQKKGSEFGYTIKEFRVQNCERFSDFTLIPDGLSVLFLGGDAGELVKPDHWIPFGEKKEISLDLNGDWIDEYFSMGYDSPNGTLLLWVYGDKGRNFVYDFSDEVTATNGEDIIEDSAPQKIEFHFGDFDKDGVKEVIVVISNGKHIVEGVIYALDEEEEGFREIGRLKGRHYLAFDGENGVFYAPYADGDRVQGYVFEAGKLIKK